MRIATAAAILVVFAASAQAAPILPQWAIGFQDQDAAGGSACGEPAASQVATQDVLARDGIFSPRAENCLDDRYVNGDSARTLDAISVHFHPQPAQDGWVLRVYLKRGGLKPFPVDTALHALKVYPGPFNATDQDCNWTDNGTLLCGTTQDEFSADTAFEGWVERPIPASWLLQGSLDLTIRLWDARVDAIELEEMVITPTRTVSLGKLKTIYR